MVLVSTRKRAILELLLDEPSGLTAGEIAAHIHVSARTIHREMDSLEALIHRHGLELVRKAGAGVELRGTTEQKKQLQAALRQQTTTEFTPQERQAIILCTLLEASEPVKLIALAIELKVTKATVSYDLDELDKRLRPLGITLLRKRGYGVELIGSESSKRRVISGLIADHLNDHQMVEIIKETIQTNKLPDSANSLTERLLQLVNREKLIKVEQVLHSLEQELPNPLADSAYIGLVTHLAMTVERVEKGENIHIEERALTELAQTVEYQTAKKIMERIEEKLSIKMPEAEAGYISMHLRGAKLRQSQHEAFWAASAELMNATQGMIRFCEERLGISLAEDSALFHGLLTHLEPALYRLKSNLEIRNPLLAQIKHNYPELFAVTREAAVRFFPDIHVPDEEVGYLVMHLGAAVERSMTEQQRYRALIVCSSGIGSSRILATRIQKEIPEIVHLQNLSLFDVGKIPKQEYDLMISTIPLPVPEWEYVMVSPLLPPEDVQKIKAHVRQTRGEPFASAGKRMLLVDGQPLQQLQKMHLYSGCALDLLDGLRVYRWDNDGESVERLLHEIGGELAAQGVVLDGKAVAAKLLRRERLGGLGIPGTEMALFHGKFAEVNQPSFTVHMLRQPLRMRSMDEQGMLVRQLLLLIGPEQMGQEQLEVVSEISSMLIEEEMQSIVADGQEEQLREYLGEQLQRFCLNKIGWERKR